MPAMGRGRGESTAFFSRDMLESVIRDAASVKGAAFEVFHLVLPPFLYTQVARNRTSGRRCPCPKSIGVTNQRRRSTDAPTASRNGPAGTQSICTLHQHPPHKHWSPHELYFLRVVGLAAPSSTALCSHQQAAPAQGVDLAEACNENCTQGQAHPRGRCKPHGLSSEWKAPASPMSSALLSTLLRLYSLFSERFF
jgi:hypothetical protein